VPFFTPSFTLPGPPVTSVDGVEDASNTAPEEGEGGSSPAAHTENKPAPAAEPSLLKVGKATQEVEVEEEDKEVVSEAQNTTSTSALAAPNVMSGLSMLQAIKELAKAHLEREGSPMGDEVLLALKVLQSRISLLLINSP